MLNIIIIIRDINFHSTKLNIQINNQNGWKRRNIIIIKLINLKYLPNLLI